jgi:DNA primase
MFILDEYSGTDKILRKKVLKNLPDANMETLVPVGESFPAPEQIPETDPESPEYQEKEIIRILLLYGRETIHLPPLSSTDEPLPVMVADLIIHDILQDELGFENALFEKIFAEYAHGIEKEMLPDRTTLLTHSDPALSKLVVDLIFTPYELSLNWAKNNILVETEEMRLRLHVEHALLSYKAKKIAKAMEMIRKNLHEKVTAEDEQLLLVKWHQLKKTSIEINKKLGRIITR